MRQTLCAGLVKCVSSSHHCLVISALASTEASVPHPFSSARSTAVGAGVAAVLAASPALAHHAMDGAVPRTMWEGFASGIAHPVIGPDHFVFVVLAALVFSLARSALPLALTLMVSGLAGTILRTMSIELPMTEALVAATLVVAGLVVLYRIYAGAGLDGAASALAVALAGVVHGFAWGESVVGADAPVLGSYLAGLAIAQFVVLMGLVVVFRSVAIRSPRTQTALVASLGIVGVFAGTGFLLLT